MDPEPPLSLIFLLTAYVVSFVSVVVSKLSHARYKELSEQNDTKSKILTQLIEKYENSSSALMALELMFYLFSLVLATKSSITIISEISVGLLLAYGLLIFVLIFLIRIVIRGFGERFADSLIVPMSSILIIFDKLVSPFKHLSEKLSLWLAGKNGEDETREELSALVESAHEEGTIGEGEYRILKNIINFSEVLISDVMTPRTVVFSLNADMLVGEAIMQPEMKMHSRVPLRLGNSLDDGVAGYVMSRDIYSAALEGKSEIPIKAFARNLLFIPDNLELDSALETFLTKQQHLFLVVDEHGGVDGIISMEDVLETILGVEIVDEADKVVDLRLLAKQKRDKRIAAKIGDESGN